MAFQKNSFQNRSIDFQGVRAMQVTGAANDYDTKKKYPRSKKIRPMTGPIIRRNPKGGR